MAFNVNAGVTAKGAFGGAISLCLVGIPLLRGKSDLAFARSPMQPGDEMSCEHERSEVLVAKSSVQRTDRQVFRGLREPI